MDNAILLALLLSCICFQLSISCQNWTYLKTVGFESNIQYSINFTVNNDLECLYLCTKMDICQFLQFDIVTKNCYFYEQNRFEMRSINPHVIQYSKICIDGHNVPSQCKKTVFRMPQKILIGLAVTVMNATSLEQCVQKCFDQNEYCLSGMFYYKEPFNNCILNSNSSAVYPDYFVDNKDDLMDYFELDCRNSSDKNRQKRDLKAMTQPRHRSLIWPQSSSWGSWTRCDGNSGSRFRYRNCASFNPNKCEKDTGSCDPVNRLQETQEIMSEEGDHGNGNILLITPHNTQPTDGQNNFVTSPPDQSNTGDSGFQTDTGGQIVTDNGMMPFNGKMTMEHVSPNPTTFISPHDRDRQPANGRNVGQTGQPNFVFVENNPNANSNGTGNVSSNHNILVQPTELKSNDKNHNQMPSNNTGQMQMNNHDKSKSSVVLSGTENPATIKHSANKMGRK